MEPPAVTSHGVGGHPSSSIPGSSGSGQQKRGGDLSGVGGFIQIDPQLSFNTPSRHFEELPENFLDTISPQQGGHAGGVHHAQMIAAMGGGRGPRGVGAHSTTSPQLASLTTVSMAGATSADGNGGYANLVPMPNSSHYISALKMESMDHLGHHPSSHQHQLVHSSGQLEKTNYGNGPAGLLSPLQLEGNRGGDPGGSLGLLSSVSVSHLHRPNGGSRTSDLLSGIRRSTNSVAYIKEEINPVSELGGYQSTPTASHHHDAYGDAGVYSMQGPSAQELERMANAETPPALSNVEITSSILASLSRDSQSPSMQQHSPHQPTHFIVHQMPPQSRQQAPQQHQMIQQQHHGMSSITTPSTSTARRSRPKQNRNTAAQAQQQSSSAAATAVAIAGHQSCGSILGMVAAGIDGVQQQPGGAGYGSMGPGAGIPRATYSTTDASDPLNAEIDDEIYIDTKDLCKRVAYELKQHSIPQAIFAERILCRSQGTLSDLLRNPKPWNRLKSGRETFRRMFNWLQQPLHIRLSILDMYKGPMASSVIPPPTPAQNSRHHHRNRRASDGNEDGTNPPQKRPRLVFTDIQKRTLQAIFKETQRPSREMQQTIAEHLRLDMSTVSNFFMNARRRSRNGNGMGDEPAPYQQIRTITPPPDSPPTAQQQQHQILGGTEHHQLQQQLLPPSMIQTGAGPTPSTSAVRRTSKGGGGMHHHHNTQLSASNLSHIEETVDEVIVRSVAYARSKQLQQQQQQQQQPHHFSLESMMQSEGVLLDGGQQQQPQIWDEDEIGQQTVHVDLGFIDGSENNGSGGSLGTTDDGLLQHKQEEEELTSEMNETADLSARLSFGIGGTSQAEEEEEAVSMVVQSIAREKEREERRLKAEDSVHSNNILEPKTPPPSRKASKTGDEREQPQSHQEAEQEMREEMADEDEMVEGEAPTEPGTPNWDEVEAEESTSAGQKDESEKVGQEDQAESGERTEEEPPNKDEKGRQQDGECSGGD